MTDDFPRDLAASNVHESPFSTLSRAATTSELLRLIARLIDIAIKEGSAKEETSHFAAEMVRLYWPLTTGRVADES